MYRIRLAAVFLLVLSASFARGALFSATDDREGTAPPADRLLPIKTTSLTLIPRPFELSANWKRTPYAILYDDPVLKPFRQELERKSGGLMGLERRTGVSSRSLMSIAGGWFASAQAPTRNNTPALIVLVDAGAKVEMAKAVLQRAGDDLLGRGASHTKRDVGETELHIYTLPSPAQSGRGASGNGSQQTRRTIHFFKQSVVGLCDDLGVAEDIVRNWSHRRKDCLANSSAYRQVMDACRSEQPAPAPDVIWYLSPYRHARLLHQASVLETGSRDAGSNMLENPSIVWPEHGFDALQGMGGAISLGWEDYELFYRIAIYAPPPYRQAMRMFDFLHDTQFAPPSWIPAEVNAYSTGYWRMMSIIDHCAALFDESFRDGIEGAFENILRDMKSRRGPGVDIRNDLVKHLGPRVLILGDHTAPASSTSERTMIAVKIQDEPKVAQAMVDLFRNDPNVTRKKYGRQQIDVWILNQGGGNNISRRTRSSQQSTFSTAAVAVAHGYLLYATNVKLIYKLLAPKTQGKLIDHPDYRRVAEKFALLHGAQPRSVEMFARVNREFYTTYELLRKGKLHDSESIYAMLAELFIKNLRKRNPSAGEIRYEKLPPFSQIERYLGPAGIVGKNWPDRGWLLMGFVLKPSGRDE